MKKISQVFLLLLVTINLSGQEEIVNIVKEGIALHDEGKYEDAIKRYNQALKIDKKSSLVNYEIGYSFFALKKYKESIKYFDIVIKNNGDYLKEAFLTKGSSLDNLGKVKKAIKIFKEGIKKYPDSYLMHYNLGLTYYNNNQKSEAEKHIIDALEVNSTHGTSNYLLGLIKSQQGKRVESLLSLYFFLLIEPDSPRSKDAFEMLNRLLNKGVTKKDSKNIQVNINSIAAEGDFSAIEMIISLSAAANSTEKDKSKEEQFYEITDLIFTTLKDSSEKSKSIWKDLYIDFYSKIVESENTEAFSYYISQSNSENAVKWIEENESKMNKFFDWINE